MEFSNIEHKNDPQLIQLAKERQLRKLLEKQQYDFAGRHTAVKICTWTKKSLKDEGVCYKQKFYGINSHRCVQMSPTVGYCTNKCIFCWREMDLTLGHGMTEIDDPGEIIDNCIKSQRKLLSGFGGNQKVNRQKLEEAMNPIHFAISLTGEPTLYPKLNELIGKLHKRGMSSFVVSNGQLPEKIRDIEPPTQLYISVDAPNESLFYEIDRPILEDAWERLLKTLNYLKSLKSKTRTTLRLTLIKGINMTDVEGWASLISIAEPLFIEVKAYMFVGSSRERLKITNMPRHHEVLSFAKKIAEASGYRVIDDKQESRVVLLMKKDFDGRIMKFD